MAFERVWENNSRSLSPKAKSTNFMPARTSKKVEILSQGKNFWGPSMLNSIISSRFRGKIKSDIKIILLLLCYIL